MEERVSEKPASKRRATQRGHARQQILEAARRLFDQRAYNDVSREDIAREAGVYPGTVHKNFATKQAVVVAAYAPYLLDLLRIVEGTAKTSRDIDRIIAWFIRLLVEYLCPRPAMAYALLPLARDQRRSKCEPAQEVDLKTLVEFLAALLERRERDTRTGDEARQAAEFCLSGLLTWIYQHPERPSETAEKLALSQLLCK
jgi:AcrR family transcriptional regulator